MSDDGEVKVLLEGIGQVVVPQQYVERAKKEGILHALAINLSNESTHLAW